MTSNRHGFLNRIRRLALQLMEFVQQNQNKKEFYWQIAYKHAKAVLVGKPILNNHHLDDSKLYCQCCDNLVEKEAVSLCQNTKQLVFLGVGFPLYFIFLKYTIILMLVQSIAVGISSLFKAVQSNYDFCVLSHPKVVPHLEVESSCSGYFILLSSIQQHLTTEIVVTRIVYFLLSLLYLVYMRDSLIKLIGYYDERSTTYSDYALILKKLPHILGLKQDFRLLLSDYDVANIVVIGSFDHIQKTRQDLRKKEEKKISIKQKIDDLKRQNLISQKLNSELVEIQQKISQIEKSLIQVVTNQQILYQKDEIIPEMVIICVETDLEKERIITQIKEKGMLTKISNGWTQEDLKNIQVRQSPQPSEIIWNNFNVSTKIRIRNNIIGWVATIVILAIISLIFYFILVQLATMIQHYAKDHSIKAYLVFYVTMILVVIINKFLLCPLIHKICHFEKYFTKEEQEYAFTLKYLLCMFFTTALMTILVEDFTMKNFYTHEFGVIQGESIMIVMSSFLIPLIWLVNPWTILIRLRQMAAKERTNLTQQEANRIMEAMPYQMGKRYAEVVKLVWLVSLYQSLIPLGTVLATIGLAFYYWVDKYNLLRRSSVREAVSGFLTLRVITLFEFSLFLKCAGELLFDLEIRYEYSVTTIVFLTILLVFFVLPRNKILRFIHYQRFNHQEKTFSDCKDSLGSSYSDLHPVTGKHMTNFINTLKLKYKISLDPKTQINHQYLSRSILHRQYIRDNEAKNKQLKLWRTQFKIKNRSFSISLLDKQNDKTTT